jgi:uncharacterized phage protein (TIGR02220 family)
MARARNIKPGFFQNEELGELLPIERLAFIGMWTIADYKGCIEFRPKRLKVQLLPYDECDMETIAINLDKSGFISIYSVQGQRYIKILNFEKHQNPHKNEREGGSDIPDIDKNDIEINKLEIIQNYQDKNGTTPADSPFPLTDSGIPSTTLSGKPDISKSDCLEILNYLNEKAGRKYQDVSANLNIIKARLKEYTADQLKAVIDAKCIEWSADEKMVPYLRPETLFNATKCAGYVGSLGMTVKANGGLPWFLSASGVEEKGIEIGLPIGRDENFANYKVRVLRKANITMEEYRKAEIDYLQVKK